MESKQSLGFQTSHSKYQVRVYIVISQMALGVKNLSANTGDLRDMGSIPGSEDPLEEVTAVPVFLPGESHGQRSLAGYNSGGLQRVGHN